MTEPSSLGEVERAFKRPDIEDLQRIISEHIAWNRACDADEDTTELPLDALIYDQGDPERNLALVAVAMATSDDPSYLGLVSAGLLESIFFAENDVSKTLLERIEAEALRNPRFRWMLSGMYTTSFKPECQDLIHRLTAGIDFGSPMPPMVRP